MISNKWKFWYLGIGLVILFLVPFFLIFIFSKERTVLPGNPINSNAINKGSFKINQDVSSHGLSHSLINGTSKKHTLKNVSPNKKTFIAKQENHAGSFSHEINSIKFHTKPQVAIIIDDLGNSMEKARPFLDLPATLTFSILPNTPTGAQIAEAAIIAGKEVMLHLPMEAEAKNEKLGEGAILTNMEDESIREQVEKDLEFLPMASGVNNHMGSKASKDERVVKAMLQVLKEKDLFIVDSWTTPGSLIYPMAEKMHIPRARRNVFLDNNQNVESIKEQIKELISIAKKEGDAIGIGHPYPETAQALLETIREFQKEGVEVVPVRELVER